MNPDNQAIQTIFKFNKHPSSSPKSIKRLHRLRQKHSSNYTQDPIYPPHPSRSYNIIYVLYDIRGHGPHYVGKTTLTAIQRRTNHINDAHNIGNKHYNTLLGKWIRHITPTNLGIFPLESIPSPELQHQYERKWILLLNTHKPFNGNKPLNVHIEHSTAGKHRNKNQQPKNQQPNNPVQPKQQHNTYVRTSHHLLSYPGILQNPPPILAQMTTQHLFKTLSILTGRVTSRYKRNPSQDLITTTKLHHKNLQKTNINDISNKIHLLTNYIIDQIMNNINIQKPPKDHTKRRFLKLLTLQHIHPLMSKLPINRILWESHPLLPHQLNSKNTTIQVIHKNDPPISAILFNFKKTTLLLTHLNDFQTIPCLCNEPQFKDYLSNNHINTTDTTLIMKLPGLTNYKQQLINLLNKGTKFKPQQNITKHIIQKTIQEALDNFIKAYENEIPQEHFNEWKQTIINKLQPHIDSINNQYADHNLYHPKMKDIITYLQDNFVINSGDKIPSNFTFTCKRHWLQTLHKALTTNKSYRIITTPETQIVTKHTSKLKTWSYTNISPTLPYNRIQFKYHKDGYRPLVSASNVTTTNLNKHLTLALQLLINQLKIEAKKDEILNGINWFMDIETTQELTQWLNTLNADPSHQPKSIRTADAKGFYDNVQHSTLKNKYINRIKKIYHHARRNFIIIKNNAASWSQNPIQNTNNTHTFTWYHLAQTLIWSLRNQYSSTGSLILKQNHGVGQGANHSGHQSRFLMICYERHFIKHLIKKNNKPIAQIFANTRRKMDDIIFINNPYVTNLPHKYLQHKGNTPGLYPKFITLEFTNSPPYTSANYLDTTIQIIPNINKNNQPQLSEYLHRSTTELRQQAKTLKLKQHGTKMELAQRIYHHYNPSSNFHNKDTIWATKTYNKKQEFPKHLRIISFPHYSSNIPHTSNMAQ